MKLDGVSSLTPPIQNAPEITTEGSESSGKANGVISKLNEGGHFNAVADVRLRIAHFDNPDLEKVDPVALPNPEDVPGNAYEKFLEQYGALYLAGQIPAEPEGQAAAQEPVAEIPASDTIPPLIEEPAAEVLPPADEPPITEEPIDEILETESILAAPLEIEPVVIPEQTAPAEEGEGILAAFQELWETQTSEEEPSALDIIA
jgi:hypothetical protein